MSVGTFVLIYGLIGSGFAVAIFTDGSSDHTITRGEVLGIACVTIILYPVILACVVGERIFRPVTRWLNQPAFPAPADEATEKAKINRDQS